MSEVPRFGRRRFLLLALGASAAAGLGWRLTGSLLGSDPVRSPAHALAAGARKLFDAVDGVSLLGRLYLDGLSRTPTPDDLVGALFSGNGPTDDLVGDTERLREHLRSSAVEDLGAGQVVAVDGWLLAESEAQLCALVALAEETA